MDDLTFFARATLNEIKKEIKKRGGDGDKIGGPAITDGLSPDECCAELQRMHEMVKQLSKQNEYLQNNMQKAAEDFCGDAFEKLREMEEKYKKAQDDISFLKKDKDALNMHAMDKLNEFSNRVDKMGTDVGKTALDTAYMDKDLKESMKLVKEISDIQLKNVQLTNAVNALNIRDDQSIIDDLRRQLLEEQAKNQKCQEDNKKLRELLEKRGIDPNQATKDIMKNAADEQRGSPSAALDVRKGGPTIGPDVQKEISPGGGAIIGPEKGGPFVGTDVTPEIGKKNGPSIGKVTDVPGERTVLGSEADKKVVPGAGEVGVPSAGRKDALDAAPVVGIGTGKTPTPEGSQRVSPGATGEPVAIKKGGPAARGPGAVGPTEAGPGTGSPAATGPAAAGSATAGPATGGPAVDSPGAVGLTGAGRGAGGPTAADPGAGGPAAAGPGAGGPAVGGPATGGPATGGPGAGGPTAGGPVARGPDEGGPGAGGPATAGPAAGGPSTTGPAAGGPGTVGPAAGGPATGGPGAGGPATASPGVRGPGAGGPTAAGPDTGGPAAGGSGAGGPTTAGPAAGGPAVGGPADGGPAAGGPGAVGPGAGVPEAGGTAVAGPVAGAPVAGVPGADGIATAGPVAGAPGAGVPGAGGTAVDGPVAGAPGVGGIAATGPVAGAPGAGGPALNAGDVGQPDAVRKDEPGAGQVGGPGGIIGGGGPGEPDRAGPGIGTIGRADPVWDGSAIGDGKSGEKTGFKPVKGEGVDGGVSGRGPTDRGAPNSGAGKSRRGKRAAASADSDAFQQFIDTNANTMISNIRAGSALEKELRAILNSFMMECGFCFCKSLVPKSKFYALCHKLLHNGIQCMSFRELAYMQRKIFMAADKLHPGCLLNMILTDLGYKDGEGFKCCHCKNALCCSNSEEMLKEKVSKLERDIEMAKEYLDSLKAQPKTPKNPYTSTGKTYRHMEESYSEAVEELLTCREARPALSRTHSKQLKTLKARIMKCSEMLR